MKENGTKNRKMGKIVQFTDPILLKESEIQANIDEENETGRRMY